MTDQPLPPELERAAREGRRIINDPYWNGGGAVCARSRLECMVVYETICAACGHPVSWHREQPLTATEVKLRVTP